MKRHFLQHTLPLALSLMLSSICLLSQETNDGIYFKIDEKKCVFKKIKQKDSSSSICITNSPIFLFEDIVWLGDLEPNIKTGVRKLLMKLSEKGSKRLAALSKIYQGDDLAFVFNDKVVFLLRINKVITSGRISLEENLDDSSLAQIREAIEKLLTQKENP